MFAAYLGTSGPADAFTAALRMPNVLQNLLGEGALSASFIPVYSELLERGREEEAGRLAGAIFALLLAVAGALSLIGILLAPTLASIFLYGFEGVRREVAIAAMRIIFPMTGLLVLSAWSLGILNSHRRFFIPYVAPVLWNAAIIATLFLLGGRMPQAQLAVALAWGALLGGALQLGIQLPWVLQVERRLRIGLGLRLDAVRTVLRNVGPAILGRGVVQISGWVDLFLATLLIEGAVAALGYAQTLYLLPVSLFGMSIAAAELPELARRRGGEASVLRERVNGGLRQMAFLVVPSVVGYLVLGDAIVAALFQRGDFGVGDTLLVYLVLVGYSVGLLASTGTRLFSSAFFALHDTRTPAKFAFVRVVLAGAGGAALMFPMQGIVVDGQPLGAVGLSAAAGVAAWFEWLALRRSLRPRIGDVGVERGVVLRMVVAAVAAAAAARALLFLLPVADLHTILRAVIALGVFGPCYFGIAHLLGLDDGRAALTLLFRRRAQTT